jgi:hypothetical protein
MLYGRERLIPRRFSLIANHIQKLWPRYERIAHN